LVNTWKVILATMLIFGTGVVTGVLLVYYAIPSGARPRAGTALRPGVLTSPGGMRLEFLRRMQRDLDLTPDQRERIDKLLKESQERSRRMMAPLAPALREEVKRAKDEFRQVLTPDQQARFDDLIKRQQRARDQRRVAPPHPETAPLTNAP
jgi:Spy/CpxP family protein refolding chaperone